MLGIHFVTAATEFNVACMTKGPPKKVRLSFMLAGSLKL